MTGKRAILMTLALVFALASSAHALLIDRGGGMIYSTDMDVTWLQDANHARTSGHDVDGRMTWDQAENWVTNLQYGGYGDWRLPTFDPDNPGGRDDSTLLHEMSYLSYGELGNPGMGSSDLQNVGPFANLPPEGSDIVGPWFWTSTEFSPDRVWRFDFDCG